MQMVPVSVKHDLCTFFYIVDCLCLIWLKIGKKTLERCYLGIGTEKNVRIHNDNSLNIILTKNRFIGIK